MVGEKVRIGLIGAGGIGRTHAKAIGATPQTQVVAVCDADEAAARALAQQCGAAHVLNDYRELAALEDVDAVVVGVPNFLHCPCTVAALRAGKHVLCEKPMALNAAEARRMVAAARDAGRVLQIGMVWRHDAESRALKDLIERGRLGRIYHMRVVLRRRRGIPGLGGWFTTRAQSGGGAMIDIGVHFLDLALWLSGRWDPVRVSAATYAEFGPRMKDYVYVSMWAGPPKYEGVFDVDDYATGLVRFAERATLSFEISWAGNNQDDSYVELLGDQGGARLLGGEPLRLFTEEAGRIADIQQHCAKSDRFAVQMQQFADACRGRAKPAATGEQGLVLMEVLDAVYRSSEQGKEVVLKAPSAG